MNNLKIDDKVNVYAFWVSSGIGAKRGIITESFGYNGFNVRLDDGTNVSAHAKQLRKLKKKQRLEGWVNVYETGMSYSLYKSRQVAVDCADTNGYIRTVKMREVRE